MKPSLAQTLPSRCCLFLFMFMDDGCWDGSSSRFGAVPAADGQTEMKRPSGCAWARLRLVGASHPISPKGSCPLTPGLCSRLCSRQAARTTPDSVKNTAASLGRKRRANRIAKKNVTGVCTSTMKIVARSNYILSMVDFEENLPQLWVKNSTFFSLMPYSLEHHK